MNLAQYANILPPVLGTFLLLAGLVLTLIPFNLAGSSANGWAEDYIIAMLVLGIVLHHRLRSQREVPGSGTIPSMGDPEVTYSDGCLRA